jgi:hypothetical protein
MWQQINPLRGRSCALLPQRNGLSTSDKRKDRAFHQPEGYEH